MKKWNAHDGGRGDENSIFVTIRKSQGSGSLKFKCKGVKLTNVEGFFGTSDPFFELARKVEAAGGQTWYVVSCC